MSKFTGDPLHAQPKGAFPVLILCALIAFALNLRSPLTSVPPVIGFIRSDLGIGATAAALLTSLPVLCFGLLAPFASRLIARVGMQNAVYVTLVGAAIGLVMRPFGGYGGMLAGTIILGAALAVGNTVSLMVIARDFPKHMGPVTGIYTAALNVGTMLTGALTAPFSEAIGWQFAIASWVWMALVALVLWLLVDRAGRRSGPVILAPVPAKPRPVWNRPITWLATLGLTTHLVLYYAVTAWLPAYLITENGMAPTTAGVVASAFQILALLGAVAVPLLSRFLPLGVVLMVMGALWVATPLGMILIPHHWMIWSLTGGMAQGGSFVTVMTMILRHATDLNDNRRMSTIVQGIGYSLGALGPIMLGSVHDFSGSWVNGLWLLTGLALLLVVSGGLATRISEPAR